MHPTLSVEAMGNNVDVGKVEPMELVTMGLFWRMMDTMGMCPMKQAQCMGNIPTESVDWMWRLMDRFWR